jgi:release factor glutamine methyltransferase
MLSSNKCIHFGSRVFHLRENVYEPSDDSFLFGENLTVKCNERVLDLGTGCGMLGILAASNARQVVAVDINPHAVRCAKANAELNEVDGKMMFFQGDLFAPLSTEARFDVILFNAPYLPANLGKRTSWIERSWAGGKRGREVIDSFISSSKNHLASRGRVMLLQSTLSSVDRTFSALRGKGFGARIVAEKKLPFFESIVLIEARA